MGDALAAPVLAALLAIMPVSVSGTPAPAPAPQRTEAPLREITRVHATTAFCRSALERASLGAAIALDNDERLAETQAFLNRVDLDTSELARANGSRELNRRYVAYRAAAVEGVGHMKALKALADSAPSDAQKQAIVAFTAALGGALDRQRKLADAVGRLVVYIDNHPSINKEEHDKQEFDAILSLNVNQRHPGEGYIALVPPTLDRIAQEGATELATRAEPVRADEDAAGAQIEPAFGGC